MFQGSIPTDMRRILLEYAQGWDVQDVYVGCSGNLTIERTLWGANPDRWRLHGNDITLYTTMLGQYFCGQPLALELQPDFAQYSWVLEHDRTAVGDLATLMLATQIAPCFAKPDHAYYGRLLEGYRQQYPQLHQETVAKLEALTFRTASFFCGDVFDYVRDSPKDAGFLSFPPFWGGGYEKLFDIIHQLFGWQYPEYEVMDNERMQKMLDNVQAFKYWVLGAKEELPQLAEYYRGGTRTSNRGIFIHIYSNQGAARLVRPQQNVIALPVPRLGEDEVVGQTMELLLLKEGQFNQLRAMYLNPYIAPASTSLPVGVVVDGKLVGAFAFSTASTLTSWDKHLEGPFIYMMSDFAVRPTAYPRLSKLVLTAALSHEAKLLAERVARRRVKSVVTTAFSQNPTSMKYRGLFDLLTRAPAAEGEHHKYKLNYGSGMGRWSLQEGLALWRKKYA